MQVTLDALVLPAFDDLAGLPSEYTPWQRAYDLTNTYEHSGLTVPLSYGDGVGVVPTGVGKSAAATTVGTLCATPAIDLSEAVICTVGVAGGPPDRTTIGDVVIAETIVDWDDKLRLDADGDPVLRDNPYSEYAGVIDLDDDLIGWALATAEDTPLESAPAAFGGGDSPTVRRGVNCCADELWHGAAVAEDVETLVRERSGAPHLVTQMEDAGTAIALDRYGLLDSYLSVRGVANADRGAIGEGNTSFDDSFEAGFGVAIRNATAVGMAVVDERST